MKIKLLITVLILVGIFGIAYAVPPPDPEHSFRYSEIVIEGRILSVGIISEPVIYRTDDDYYEQSGIAVYDVQVEKSLKNPDDVKIITVAGYFLRDPHPMAYETYPYDVGQTVLLYLQENTRGYGDTDLIIRSSTSKIIDNYDSDLEPFPSCKSGPAPEGNFVFFDCKWVEIPHGWIFQNGLWQEDPSVQKLGPVPLPTCPRIDLCTCSGKYNYYNATNQQCYSSPYMPDSYEKTCEGFSQMEFDGWNFNTKSCNWIPKSDQYDDESMRLASEKVGLGGLGISPEFDTMTIIIGMMVAAGITLGLLLFWRRK